MTITWNFVIGSSNLDAFRYADGVFDVRFRGGSQYRYHDVPADVYDGFVKAESKGSYLARHIARNECYRCEKLPPEP